jgi:hypothetical protein
LNIRAPICLFERLTEPPRWRLSAQAPTSAFNHVVATIDAQMSAEISFRFNRPSIGNSR